MTAAKITMATVMATTTLPTCLSAVVSDVMTTTTTIAAVTPAEFKTQSSSLLRYFTELPVRLKVDQDIVVVQGQTISFRVYCVTSTGKVITGGKSPLRLVLRPVFCRLFLSVKTRNFCLRVFNCIARSTLFENIRSKVFVPQAKLQRSSAGGFFLLSGLPFQKTIWP